MAIIDLLLRAMLGITAVAIWREIHLTRTGKRQVFERKPSRRHWGR